MLGQDKVQMTDETHRSSRGQRQTSHYSDSSLDAQTVLWQPRHVPPDVELGLAHAETEAQQDARDLYGTFNGFPGHQEDGTSKLRQDQMLSLWPNMHLFSQQHARHLDRAALDRSDRHITQLNSMPHTGMFNHGQTLTSIACAHGNNH